MGKIGDLWVKLKLKAEEFKAGLKDADSGVKSFAGKIKGLKASSLAIFAGIAAGVYKIADAFAHTSQTIGDAWDSAMTQVSTRWHQILSELNRGSASGGVKGFFGALFGGSDGSDAMAAGKALAAAQDAMTEINYAFRLSMAEEQPELHELYLKMMNSALSASEREAAASEYRKRVEDIYAPRVKGLKDIMDKTVAQYLTIGGIDSGKYSAEKTKELIKMMSSDPAKVEREYKDFFDAYQSIGDTVSGNLVQTMETYYGATNEMNDLLKRVDRTAQSQANAGLDELTKKLGQADDGLADFKAQVAEEAEIMAADEEYQRLADTLEEFEQVHADVLNGMTHKQRVFADMAQETFADAVRGVEEYVQAEQEALDLGDEAVQTALDNLQAKADIAEELNQALSEALVASISDSTQAFTDMLFGLEGADASAILGALLQPFADMIKKAGEMIVAYETSIAIVKENMFSNPYVAIAAGAALVALGSALSSGLQSMGASLGSAGSASASAGSTGSTTASADISTEMTIYVKGKISGKDILISGDNARNYYGR